MTLREKILLLCVFAFFTLNLAAQDQVKIDSLTNLLVTVSEEDRYNILIDLSLELARPDPAQALEYADEAITLTRRLDKANLEIEAIINKGIIYERSRDDENALKTFLDALEVSEEKQYKKGRAVALYRIGRSYAFQYEHGQAEDYLSQALQLAREIKDGELEGMILFNQGDNLSYMNKFDDAVVKYDEAIQVAERENDINTLASVYSNKGIKYAARGDYNEAIQNYEKSLQYYIELGDRLRQGSLYLNIANSYVGLAKYDLAIENYQKALPIFEEFNERFGIAAVYNGMAVIYVEQKFYDKALENHLKKLEISREMGNLKEVGNALNNIAIVYLELANDSISKLLGRNYTDSIIEEPTDKYLKIYSQALDYSQQALKIREEMNDRPGLVKTLNNLGTLYMYSGKLNQALEYYERARSLSEELNDIPELANSLLWIGEIYHFKGQYERALYYLNQSLEYALEIDIKRTIQAGYERISEVYTRMGNFKQALEYHKMYTAVKDSISRKETLDMISEMQVKYETDAVIKDNQLLTAQSELDQAKVRQQRIAIYFFIFVLLSISTLVVLLVRQNNQRKLANHELAQKNALITEQKKEITDSIQYASRIQSALLPPGDYIDQLIPERFIIYMPRDIVSGDYYWITEKNNKVICIAADCTGHGVPGAFMSMLGIAFLNEIISKQDEMHTDEILNEMRAHVIKSLHQTGKEGESQDGMDIAIYILDLQNRKLEYSGANNSLFLYRDSEMIELKADKMPIGIHTRADIPFTRHNVDIQRKDMIYTFSDGYPDQFGGPHQKKFMVKNFKNILAEIHTRSVKEQKEILQNTLKEWMADTDQIDDILVIGVRL
jgi:serine phosphatase RsbU (regulator of sigma subunit)/Tfp pilus assembly protein PilF